MSRHGYVDDADLEPLELGQWRGRVASAIRGRRGQELLCDLRDALDAMPEKRLIAKELESEGEVCALGAVGRKRGIDMKGIDPEDSGKVAATFNIAECLAREITFINDEWGSTPEQRWKYVREWVEKKIAKGNHDA